MKIAVVAANGKAGQLIVKEALARALTITAYPFVTPIIPLPKGSLKRTSSTSHGTILPGSMLSSTPLVPGRRKHCRFIAHP